MSRSGQVSMAEFLLLKGVTKITSNLLCDQFYSEQSGFSAFLDPIGVASLSCIFHAAKIAEQHFIQQRNTSASMIFKANLTIWTSLFQGYDSDNKKRCDILENLVSLGCEYSSIKKPDHEVNIDQVQFTWCPAGLALFAGYFSSFSRMINLEGKGHTSLVYLGVYRMPQGYFKSFETYMGA